MSGAAEKKEAWTPGPWHVTPSQCGVNVTIDKGVRGLRHYPIADVHNAESIGGIDAGRANARLIAAAPELVEALRKFTQLRSDAGAIPAAAKRDLLKYCPEFIAYLDEAEALLTRIGGR